MFMSGVFIAASKFRTEHDSIVLWSVAGKKLGSIKLIEHIDKWPITYTRLKYYVNYNFDKPIVSSRSVANTAQYNKEICTDVDDTPCFNVIINWDYTPQPKNRLVQKIDHIIIIELENHHRMPKSSYRPGTCALCTCNHDTILECVCGNIIHVHEYSKYVDYYNCCYQTATKECSKLEDYVTEEGEVEVFFTNNDCDYAW